MTPSSTQEQAQQTAQPEQARPEPYFAGWYVDRDGYAQPYLF